MILTIHPQGITECNFAGILLSGLEVKNPVTPISQTAFLSHELRGYFTTLVHTPLDEVNFLFAGSSEGILFQVSLSLPYPTWSVGKRVREHDEVHTEIRPYTCTYM